MAVSNTLQHTMQWFQCNSEIVALGLYDDAELKEYFFI